MLVTPASLAAMRRILASDAVGEPGVAEIEAAARRGLSDAGARRWMTLANRELGGLIPAEAIAAGRGADALAAAFAMVFADAS